MHDKEHVGTQQNLNDMDDDEFEDGKDEEAEEGPEGQNMPGKIKKMRQRSRKKTLHKKFSTNFISLIVKFLVVVTILEGYFLLSFFMSDKFLGTVNSIIEESGSITYR